eukprot:sb/3473883/
MLQVIPPRCNITTSFEHRKLDRFPGLDQGYPSHFGLSIALTPDHVTSVAHHLNFLLIALPSELQAPLWNSFGMNHYHILGAPSCVVVPSGGLVSFNCFVVQVLLSILCYSSEVLIFAIPPPYKMSPNPYPSPYMQSPNLFIPFSH